MNGVGRSCLTSVCVRIVDSAEASPHKLDAPHVRRPLRRASASPSSIRAIPLLAASFTVCDLSSPTGSFGRSCLLRGPDHDAPLRPPAIHEGQNTGGLSNGRNPAAPAFPKSALFQIRNANPCTTTRILFSCAPQTKPPQFRCLPLLSLSLSAGRENQNGRDRGFGAAAPALTPGLGQRPTCSNDVSRQSASPPSSPWRIDLPHTHPPIPQAVERDHWHRRLGQAGSDGPPNAHAAPRAGPKSPGWQVSCRLAPWVG